jgi:broad specificity phosphatase PhoE
MQLIIVRHGHPEVPTDGHSGNPPLSARGMQQAQHAADVLKMEPITRIISSGMRRADSTAQPLADALGLPIETHPDLGEVDRWGGAYANVETITQKGPEELQRFREAPIAYFGIDADRFRRETLTAFKSVIDGAGGATIAVFTHGFPINILFSHALGIGHDDDIKYVPAHGSISRISGHAFEELAVMSWNENDHIPEILK